MELPRNGLSILLTTFLGVLSPTLAGAEETTSPRLSPELNAADTVGESCRLTFLLRNEMEQDIDQFIVETVLFSKSNQVVLLTLFDFAALPIGRPRVRQFQVPDTSCDGLGMVLVNGADTCSGGALTAAICEKSLSVSSRTAIPLEG
ncbi:MAG: hypothetical protein AAF754_07265 [Pseudomonadota bacterium]